jgi:hypothetical protein
MRNELAIEGLARLGYDGRHWYEDGRKQIEYVCNAEGWDRRDFTAILAVTSPRCVVRRNIRLTLHWMKFGKLPVGTMKSITRACVNWRDSNAISGPKVSVFFDALYGNDDCIVWDTHMFRAFAGKDNFRKKELAKAESILRAVAVTLDLTPCQCQAAVWAGWRQLEGWNRSDYPVCEEWLNFVKRGSL